LTFKNVLGLGHGPGPREQPELPTVEQVHEFAEPDRVCPKCGGALSEMTGQYEEGDEDHPERLDHGSPIGLHHGRLQTLASLRDHG
jgi:hypothetical protein